MAYLENLIARRDQIAADLAALDATKAGGGVNSTASGVDHSKKLNDYYMELARLNELIDKAQSSSDGPIEIISTVIT